MMIKQLAAQLEQLKMIVKSKTAVPTSQVFVSICRPLWPCVFETDSQCVALTDRELAMWTRLASNSQLPTDLCPWVLGSQARTTTLRNLGFFICIFICLFLMAKGHATIHMWRSENTFHNWFSALSGMLGSNPGCQAPGCFYPLSHSLVHMFSPRRSNSAVHKLGKRSAAELSPQPVAMVVVVFAFSCFVFWASTSLYSSIDIPCCPLMWILLCPHPGCWNTVMWPPRQG